MTPQILETLKKMEKLGYHTHVFPTALEMRDFVLSSIPEEASIGFGGSVTVVSELMLYDLFEARGNTVYYHGKCPVEEKLEMMHKANSADVYMMSSSAITEEGRILNVDGIGNRLAALCCGPKTVYILVGVNKFVKDDEAAIKRMREIAAPKNAVRLARKTPCAVTGKCADCDSPDRICKLTLWLERVPTGGREFHICVADESLGF